MFVIKYKVSTINFPNLYIIFDYDFVLDLAQRAGPLSVRWEATHPTMEMGTTTMQNCEDIIPEVQPRRFLRACQTLWKCDKVHKVVLHLNTCLFSLMLLQIVSFNQFPSFVYKASLQHTFCHLY